MTIEETATLTADEAYEIRAAAHAAAPATLRVAQRFRDGVTDLQVALAMLAIERGIKVYRNRAGRWFMPKEGDLQGYGQRMTAGNLSPVIGEMIRTGLVRHWIDRDGDHLIPAKVHMMSGGEGRRHSTCLFTGEDLGPMRSRLVAPVYFSLVDCLDCEQFVATDRIRGL